METDIRTHLKTLYLDWVNEWLSTANMAAAYGIPVVDMIMLVEMGQKYHEEDLNNG